MKQVLLVLLICYLFNENIFCQNNFDNKLQEMAEKLASRIEDKSSKQIAVWDFTDLDGKVTNLGIYISDNLSVYLKNSLQKLQVIDRNNLNTILKEHQLKSEGYVDPDKAILLGKFIQGSLIVTGKITAYNQGINITMKVLDTETGDISAALISDLPLNNKIKDILGISHNDDKIEAYKRESTSSGEKEQQKSANTACIQNNTGDYCFQNNKDIDLGIRLLQGGWMVGNCTIQPGQKQCFYDLKAGSYSYEIGLSSEMGPGVNVFYPEGVKRPYHANGAIYIKACEQNTFIIK